MNANQTRTQRTRTASRQRREQEKEELRQTILAAAAALFLEHGYEAFSLRQVAEQIGYSPTTIYLHFDDKTDLLFAVVDDAYADFSRRLQAAYDSTDDPLARIRALGDAYVDFGLANPAIYEMIFMHRTEFLVSWRKGEERPRASSLLILQRAVVDAQHAGAVRQGDVQSLGDALWAVVHGLVSLSISLPMFDAVRGRASAEAALNLMIDAMRP
jgi:AcrR family transcriptional regulator